ncbi:hypothetical protein OS242_10925 [Tumebacillus sp. DT12]|uniref:Uncharacterized protein n=1 Tax=Tumebacillus lacus TaxID=2995335 RepID=A0ABT3X0N5_9BACL|nr:hypothetical protein [Tumebacillus lacus]MCX7570474.1 hypothetical protein [Tumebacillus lacus]
MTPNVHQIVLQMSELSKQLSEHQNEILKLQTSDFIRAFVSMTTAIEQLDSVREVMRGRADNLLSRPDATERKLRKEHLKLVVNNK